MLDITEIRDIEQALNLSEKQFSTLFNNSPIPKLMLNVNGITDCNQASLDLFGYESVKEILGLFPDELSPPIQIDGRDSYVAVHEYFAAALKDGIMQFEWLHKRKDGSIFPADVSFCRFNSKGELVVVAAIRDITEKQKANEQLMFMSQFIDNSSDGFYVIDPRDASYIYVNKNGYERLGYTKEEIYKLKVWDLEGTFPTPEEYRALANKLREAGWYVMRGYHIRKDGSRFPVEVTMQGYDRTCCSGRKTNAPWLYRRPGCRNRYHHRPG